MTEVSSDTRLVPDLTTAPTSYRTSQMAPLIVEYGDTFLSYPPVVFDAKPARRQAVGRNGRAFGSIEACEPVPMSADNARWVLAAVYGMDSAESMMLRADNGEYVFGDKRELAGRGSKGKIRGGTNVAADKSRPGNYVIQVIAFVQGGIK